MVRKKLKKIEKRYYEIDFSKESNSNLKLLVVLALLGLFRHFIVARDIKEFLLFQSHLIMS